MRQGIFGKSIHTFFNLNLDFNNRTDDPKQELEKPNLESVVIMLANILDKLIINISCVITEYIALRVTANCQRSIQK